VGLDAMTGAELWSTPFPDEWHENIVTPVWTGTHLIVSGVRQGTHAFALSQTAGKWQATEVWKNADVAMYMSSPVYGDGVIYGLSEKKKGQFVALDARTGVLRWATEGREGDHASVLLTPRNLIYLTNGGDLIIADRASASSTAAAGPNAASGSNAASGANAASRTNAASAFKIEKRYDVADAETWAVPILLGADILIRDSTGLMRLTAGP